jgi:heavy metal translocating P-type ATPase
MTLEAVVLMIEGMTSALCLDKIQKVLEKLSGVRKVSLDFLANRAKVTYDDLEIPPQSIVEAVNKTGYRAEIIKDRSGEVIERGDERTYFYEFVVSALLTLPLILQMITSIFGIYEAIPIWMEALLATIVQFWCGRRFYQGATYAIKAGSANRDVSIAFGTSIAYFVGLFFYIFDYNYPSFFEMNSAIITLTLMGRWLECRIKRQNFLDSDRFSSSFGKMMQDIQNSKMEIQKFSDPIASFLVPIVVAISIATFIWWLTITGSLTMAVTSYISVLMIASPYLIGLSVPSVIRVVAVKAAEMGIFFKEASAIEKTKQLNILVFDKAGILVKGMPLVKEVIGKGNFYPEDVIKIAAALEHHSEHPIAAAILSYANEKKIPIEPTSNVHSFPGKGVSAFKRNKQYYLGSLRFAKERKVLNIDMKLVEKMEKRKLTTCIVWNESDIVGYIAIDNKLREDSVQVIQEINRMNIQTALLTGDERKTAAYIAKELGVREFYAEVISQKKAEKIMQIKKNKKRVGMVGNGIYDAPALAAADVGFSIDAGSNIAIEASDVTLITGKITSVVAAIKLARSAFLKIKQNLCFALVYNVLGVSLAAFGYLNPILAAALTGLSPLFILNNSLKLKNWRTNDFS